VVSNSLRLRRFRTTRPAWPPPDARTGRPRDARPPRPESPGA